MARMLVIDAGGSVVNVVVTSDSTAEGGAAWSPPTGTRVEPAPQGVGIGWIATAEGWQPPAPPEEPS